MSPPSRYSSAFTRTHWTVVLEAARPDSLAGQAAFGKLYSDYWQPLYAYVRRRGYPPEEAQDITQSFFTRILEKNALQNLRREGGRFRSFLLVSLGNFLANEWDRARARKRGGGTKLQPLQTVDEEELGTALEIPSLETPETLFEKRWVATLLRRVTDRLRAEQLSSPKQCLFEDLEPHIQRDPSGMPYAEVALKHTMSEGAIKVAVHRLRERYRGILREEIARTVSSESEIDDELRHLIRVISH